MAEELKKEQDPATKEKIRKSALRGGIVGAVVWGGFTIAAAIMLVSMGAWAWVVWPFALYWYTQHIARVVESYKKIVKPQKWEQHVTVNVTSNPEMTPEQIAEAASRAVKHELRYSL